ncbi:MAG: M23 family metallopeptidase [Thermoanaerobaculia bacterium]|nr:M23 family metallopeptidase [Thermoanaerobaculia bacterium]
MSRREPWWTLPGRPTWLRVGAIVVTVLAFASTVRFLVLERSGDELARMQVENARLREVNRSFETHLRSLQTRLAEQERRTNQLAIIAGIDRDSERVEGVGGEAPAGVGGASDPGDLVPDIGHLAARSEALRRQLDAVVAGLDERSSRIGARPSVSPVRGIVTSGYGERTDPLTGAKAFHRGVDISAPPGNQVFATADGIVTQAGRKGNFGRSVYISHGFGYATRYAHLSSIEVEPGDAVRRGQPIGKVGNSGRATGFHVHYEVHLDGRSRNPLTHILD